MHSNVPCRTPCPCGISWRFSVWSRPPAGTLPALSEEIDKGKIRKMEDDLLFDFRLHRSIPLSSFFLENSRNAAVSTSASRPLKKTRYRSSAFFSAKSMPHFFAVLSKALIFASVISILETPVPCRMSCKGIVPILRQGQHLRQQPLSFQS